MKKKNKIIISLGIGLLATTTLAVGILSSPVESNTKHESNVASEKKEKTREAPEISKKNIVPSEAKEEPKNKEKASATNEAPEKEIPLSEEDKEVSEHFEEEPEQIETILTEEKLQPESQNNVLSTRNLVSASAFATTQYSHTTATHSEGETYSISSSPVLVSGNTISGTITRTGVGAEKGSIILNYALNFDEQGRYLSGDITSSGYVTAQINLTVGEVYTGTVADVITTSTGYALSGSLLYPVRAAFDFQF